MTQLDLSKHYQPHEGQMLIHQSPAQYKYLEMARRYGKSRGAFGELLRTYEACLNLDRPDTLVPPGMHAWVVVPALPQGRQTWHELLQLLPKQFIKEVHRDEGLIYLNGRGKKDPTWGLIELKSAHDPDSLQSVGLDFLWMQEAHDIQDAAFAKVLPMLRSPDRLGRAVYEGIPALYPEHWFWRGCAFAERTDNKKYFYMHATAFDNPTLTEEHREEIETDRELFPEADWRRMYLAERSMSAGFFKNIDACIHGDLLSEPIPGHSYVAGLDLGVSRDFTVLIVMDADTREVAFHHLWDGTPWPQARHHINQLCKEWGVQNLVPDASGMGKAMVQELIDMGLPIEDEGFNITGSNRQDLLSQLVVAMERETISFPPIPALLRQLRAFQLRRSKNVQAPRAEAPPGEHDDEVFALALCLVACNPPQESQSMKPIRNGRYLPTQAEANGWNGRSLGAQQMRERKAKRMLERAEASGVKF
jgi:hypothetical protein